MGTRCGDLDPAVVLYLQNATGRGPKEMDKLFNKESGLLGLAGKSDVRAILEESSKGDDRANLAMNVSSSLTCNSTGCGPLLLNDGASFVGVQSWSGAKSFCCLVLSIATCQHGAKLYVLTAVY